MRSRGEELLERKVPEGLVEYIRKCRANQLVNHRLDEGQSQLPHAVDDSIGQLVEGLSLQQVLNVQLHSADAVHLHMDLDEWARTADAPNAGGLTEEGNKVSDRLSSWEQWSQFVSQKLTTILVFATQLGKYIFPCNSVPTCNRRGWGSSGLFCSSQCLASWRRTRTRPPDFCRGNTECRRCAGPLDRHGTWSPRIAPIRTRIHCAISDESCPDPVIHLVAAQRSYSGAGQRAWCCSRAHLKELLHDCSPVIHISLTCCEVGPQVVKHLPHALVEILVRPVATTQQVLQIRIHVDLAGRVCQVVGKERNPRQVNQKASTVWERLLRHARGFSLTATVCLLLISKVNIRYVFIVFIFLNWFCGREDQQVFVV